MRQLCDPEGVGRLEEQDPLLPAQRHGAPRAAAGAAGGRGQAQPEAGQDVAPLPRRRGDLHEHRDRVQHRKGDNLFFKNLFIKTCTHLLYMYHSFLIFMCRLLDFDEMFFLLKGPPFYSIFLLLPW